jgi:hypothetical protein
MWGYFVKSDPPTSDGRMVVRLESELTFKYTQDERLSYAENISAQFGTCDVSARRVQVHEVKQSQLENFVVGRPNVWSVPQPP